MQLLKGNMKTSSTTQRVTWPNFLPSLINSTLNFLNSHSFCSYSCPLYCSAIHFRQYFFFLRYVGLSLLWPLPLRSTGSGRAGSAAMAHGPSRSAACGIFPDRGTNPRPLHRQADSQPLRHQGSPIPLLLSFGCCPVTLDKKNHHSGSSK